VICSAGSATGSDATMPGTQMATPASAATLPGEGSIQMSRRARLSPEAARKIKADLIPTA
jgi:hypothetical protein